MPATVQPLEIVWFGIGLLGTAFSAPLVLRFWRAMRGLRDEGLRILARQWLGTALIGLGCELVIMFTGVVAMFIKPATATPVTPTLSIITVGLLLLGVGSSATSWWQSHSKRLIDRHLAQRRHL
jgi:hypothetical protein